MAAADGNTQFSITLPDEVLKMFEQLYPLGLYGKTRAEVARQLILDMMKRLSGEKIIKFPP